MEIFLPSFLILAFAAIVVFTILPRFGPLVLTVLSLVLLIFGAYHHWALFKTEYRLSTWQDSMVLKALAPALILGLLFVIIIAYILSFFGTGVPVPNVQEAVANVINTAQEAVNTITENVANTVANAGTAVTNAANNAVNMANNVINNRNFNIRNNRAINNIGSLANKVP